MQTLIKDLRNGVRSLLKRPGFAAVVVLTLALGVGANTAIFSIVHAVLLRPLPFPEQERLVVAWEKDTTANTPFVELSVAEIRDWQAQNQSFTSLAAMPTTVYGYGHVLTGRGDPVQLESAPVSGSFFGLAPALQSSETDLNETLNDGGRSGAGDARGNRIRRVLVVCEIALALVVLVCAGLLTRSFLRLRQTSPGLDYHNVLTMAVTLPQSRYAEPYQQAKFYEQTIEVVRTLPGVTDVAVASDIPLVGPSGHFRVYIEGVPDPGSEKVPRVPGKTISSDYFRLLKIPMVAGRSFNEADGDKAAKVTVINESFARRFWPNQNPLGKRFAYTTNRILCEVVGVVKDTKSRVSDIGTREEMYFPAPQRPRLSMSLLVRTRTGPTSLAAAIQREILNIDKDQAVTEVATLEQVVGESIEQPRLTMFLLGIFGLVALTLAAIGIYGVMAYAVAQRTREIGIRMALGAQSLDVLKLIVRNGMILAAIGVAIGLGGAFALTRLMASLLFEVTATDATTFAIVSVGLLAVALLACYIPARRATKVDPLTALRYE